MVMNIRVLTPDRVICSTTADEVVLPGLTGQVGVLDGHAALITALDTGLLRIKLNEKWTPIILCGGLAEIDRNRVTVLVNDVEELSNIELSEAFLEFISTFFGEIKHILLMIKGEYVKSLSWFSLCFKRLECHVKCF